MQARQLAGSLDRFAYKYIVVNWLTKRKEATVTCAAAAAAVEEEEERISCLALVSLQLLASSIVP